MQNRKCPKNRRYKIENYIGDYVELRNVDKSKFNLITAGCGCGKSYFARNEMMNYYFWQGINYEDCIFVTSRAIILQQQAKYENMVKYDSGDMDIINHWNGQDDDVIGDIRGSGMRLMTYDKLINIICNKGSSGGGTLSGVKLIILDECHTLFSDTFISNIMALKVWLRDMMDNEEKIIIGMTATPDIVEFYHKQWGVEINHLNKVPVIKYRAKKLTCTTFDSIPYLVTAPFSSGKTLIMCSSIKDCKALKEQIPNSTILVSRNARQATAEMDRIRDYISNHETLPEKYLEIDENGNSHWFDLNVLIVTTTAREGYNLCEESGVRNVISCLSDSLHVAQIAGRCRYNLDNLVVADRYRVCTGTECGEYLPNERRLFHSFMNNKKQFQWFNTVSHLVEGEISDVVRFSLGSDAAAFVEYINSRYLVPIGATEDEAKQYRIYKKEDKDAIRTKFVACKMTYWKLPDVSFNRVVNCMVNSLGYNVETGRFEKDSKKHTYKLIIGYDESQCTYEPAVPSCDDLNNSQEDRGNE